MKSNKQSGFTLVEIAIVLVIIGLLLGGVLKGQAMIDSARVKSLVNDMKGVQTMVNAYQDRYKVLPGDDSTAATRFPALAPDPVASNGNGDGLIAGGKFDNAAVETKFFWQHVRRANLAAGSAAIPSTVAATYLPSNPYGGVIGFGSTVNITGLPGSMSVCANNTTGTNAVLIDTAIDDGIGNSGAFRVRANLVTGVATNNAAAGVAAPVAATLYVVCLGF